jgi:isoleucyl-tRNA synthetase
MNKAKSQKNPWEHTIVLPQTVFPMRAELARRENDILAIWKKENLFRKINEKRKAENAPVFLLHDGPPYANGEFHTGHALNKILKDIFNKYNLLRGRRVPYVPGWDCHGLPIELAVIKKLSNKKDGSDKDPIRIRKACREYASQYIQVQGEDQTRFGVFWDDSDYKTAAHNESSNYYATMSPKYEAAILRAFRDLYLKGFIYKGKKPVYWDATTASAHAEAEIEYQEHESDAIYVKFPIRNRPNAYVVIWTTTPWTLPANLGVCFSEKINYVAVTTDMGELILAADLVHSVLKAAGLENRGQSHMRIEEIQKLEVRHPFLDRESRVLFGDHVTADAGTGIVHTAPGHGQDDYNVGLKYGLEILSPVDHRGRYTQEFAEMEGKTVFEANPLIIEKLKRAGLLLAHERFKHQYPHSWRSHKPLIMRATPQWFMKIEPLRELALNEIPKIEWVPEWGESRFSAAIKSRPDWCLSRQRYWGVPIPAFQCKNCGQVLMNEKTLNHVIQMVEVQGIEVWYEKPAGELLPSGTKCTECGSTDFEKESDILDVWFDSGVSWYAVLKDNPELGYPADVYLEGSDQHRGWFQSSLWPALALTGRAPYKKVVTHGYILDEQGRAMSKSLGNGMNPRADIIDKFGADVLRLWVASEDYRTDNKIGPEVLNHLADAYRKIRNTLRYLLGNIQDGRTQGALRNEGITQKLDLWVLAEAAELVKQVTDAYEKAEFHVVYHRILHFCTVTLSNLYLDMVRDTLYCDATPLSLSAADPRRGKVPAAEGERAVAAARRNSTLRTLEILTDTLLTLLAPILSFTAEEAQRVLTPEHSVFENSWPDLACFANAELLQEFEVLKKIRAEVNAAIEPLRKAGEVGSDAEVEVEICEQADEGTLLRFLGVSSVKTGARELKVRKSTKPKCPRCWLHRDLTASGLCQRCDAVVEGL